MSKFYQETNYSINISNVDSCIVAFIYKNKFSLRGLFSKS